ncbi:c-type cytochrome, partial [Brevundimonas diminuta]
GADAEQIYADQCASCHGAQLGAVRLTEPG